MPYEEGEHMPLRRLELAIEYKQKKVGGAGSTVCPSFLLTLTYTTLQTKFNYLISLQFVAHPNIQQLLAAIWYEGLPGFRRKGLGGRLLEIAKVIMHLR